VRFSQGALLAAAAAIAYGSLGVFAKLAYANGWNVPSLLAVRFGLAALCLLPFALRAPGPWRGFGAALVLGAIGYAATTALYFPSILYLPPAVAAFLLYLAPVIVAALSYFLLGERLGARGAVALGLALAGLALLASGAFTGALSLLGVALATGSAVAYAFGIVFGRRVAQAMHWSRVAFGVCLGACAAYVAFGLATQQLAVPAAPRALLWAFGIGALATGIAMPLFYAALARTSASEVAVISTLEPVSTLVLAAIFLADVPAWTGIVGGLLIVGAAALVAGAQPVVAPHE
jgi:drug/metabolite transporter (DMT)-like permease